jgi:hypothetical protein
LMKLFLKGRSAAPRFFLLCAILVASLGLAPAQEKPETDYRVELENIPYRRTVPAAIKRAAKGARRTRFYTSFRRGKKVFGVHLYDIGPVTRRTDKDVDNIGDGNYQRISRVDVFGLMGKRWQLMHRFDFRRIMTERKDTLTVTTEFTWLDPQCKSLPLLYLSTVDGPEGFGTVTDVYGVLDGKSGAKAFLSFNCYRPVSAVLSVSSWLSFPDENGRLTLISYNGDASGTSETAFGWTGDNWEKLEAVSFALNEGSAMYWNGCQYVPYPKAKATP